MLRVLVPVRFPPDLHWYETHHIIDRIEPPRFCRNTQNVLETAKYSNFNLKHNILDAYSACQIITYPPIPIFLYGYTNKSISRTDL